MCLDQVLDDRQTEPRAAFLARATRVYAVEALEDAGQVIRRDAAAGVGDSHDRGASCALYGDMDPTASWRVPQRVVEQVGEDLPQSFGVAVDRRPVRCAFKHDIQA